MKHERKAESFLSKMSKRFTQGQVGITPPPTTTPKTKTCKHLSLVTAKQETISISLDLFKGYVWRADKQERGRRKV